ncbi:hypothetical protein [Haloplanus salinus]|uniref:hypothetical protein n=1 Tax=Haloplanus salinus TaxID=1126245 RepID=UPI0011C04CED|nr:hypothetical protein [Haloplanus salinus]
MAPDPTNATEPTITTVAAFEPVVAATTTDDAESFPTGAASGTTADPGHTFAFTVDRIGECSRTCRDEHADRRRRGGERRGRLHASTPATAPTGTCAGRGGRVGAPGAGES